MLLRLKSEGIAVNAWVGVAGVVVEWLDEVEVLAGLLGEAVLAVENELEGVQGANLARGKTSCLCAVGSCATILSPEDVGV